jgi:hypothetical protein
MKTQTIFYHAGCPVCIPAEQQLAAAIDAFPYSIEVVHLGVAKQRAREAGSAGFQSVPTRVIDGQPFHINFGAAIADLQ